MTTNNVKSRLDSRKSYTKILRRRPLCVIIDEAAIVSFFVVFILISFILSQIGALGNLASKVCCPSSQIQGKYFKLKSYLGLFFLVRFKLNYFTCQPERIEGNNKN